ncbi:unnamed protein product, partial [Laminaria digitata]
VEDDKKDETKEETKEVEFKAVAVEEKEKEAEKEAAEEEPMSEKDAESAFCEMLEFYFGDSNFGWDRFMQAKAGKMGDRLMDVSLLLTFNKLKTLAKKAQLSGADAEAMVARAAKTSSSLRVSEDKTQIGRKEPMTEVGTDERMARTVQTKGYSKDSNVTIEDIEKLFADVGKAVYVKICKVGGRKL